MFGTSERFIDPARCCPAAYLVQRARRGQGDRRGRRRGLPHGARPDPLQPPAADRRCAVPRLRGEPVAPAHARLHGGLDGPRRRRQARRPAAALGGEPGRRQLGRGRHPRGPHRRLQLRLGHGGGPVPAGLRHRGDRRPAPVLAALPDRRDHADRGEAAVFTQAPEIYQITAAPTGRAARRRAFARVEIEETIGVSDGTPGQTFATRFAPVLALAPGETLEVKTGDGDWEPWEQRRLVRRLRRGRPPLRDRPRPRAHPPRARAARRRRRRDAARRHPGQGRDPAHVPLPPRRRPDRQCRRRHDLRAAQRACPASPR